MQNIRPELIAIVLDPKFSAQLPSIATSQHVWITPSPENSAAVKKLWMSNLGKDSMTLTIWSKTHTGKTSVEWESILDDIESHHGSNWGGADVCGIRVYGASLTDSIRTVLSAFNYTAFEPQIDGFLALKASVARTP